MILDGVVGYINGLLSQSFDQLRKDQVDIYYWSRHLTIRDLSCKEDAFEKEKLPLFIITGKFSSVNIYLTNLLTWIFWGEEPQLEIELGDIFLYITNSSKQIVKNEDKTDCTQSLLAKMLPKISKLKMSAVHNQFEKDVGPDYGDSPGTGFGMSWNNLIVLRDDSLKRIHPCNKALTYFHHVQLDGFATYWKLSRQELLQSTQAQPDDWKDQAYQRLRNFLATISSPTQPARQRANTLRVQNSLNFVVKTQVTPEGICLTILNEISSKPSKLNPTHNRKANIQSKMLKNSVLSKGGYQSLINFGCKLFYPFILIVFAIFLHYLLEVIGQATEGPAQIAYLLN